MTPEREATLEAIATAAAQLIASLGSIELVGHASMYADRLALLLHTLPRRDELGSNDCSVHATGSTPSADAPGPLEPPENMAEIEEKYGLAPEVVIEAALEHRNAPNANADALAAIFKAAGWAYTPDLATFSPFERGVWTAAAAALTAAEARAYERAKNVCEERSAWAEAKIEDTPDTNMWADYSTACDDCAELISALATTSGETK